MKREDLKELQRLLKQYKKAKKSFWDIVNQYKTTDEKLKAVNQERIDLISQMRPLLYTLTEETASLPDPVMRSAVVAWYRGVRLRHIAEPIDRTEDQVKELIEDAERMLISDDEQK